MDCDGMYEYKEHTNLHKSSTRCVVLDFARRRPLICICFLIDDGCAGL